MLCVVAFALSYAAASAQSSSSLVLDAASLTPVNADAVTGLALDPIVKDRSNPNSDRAIVFGVRCVQVIDEVVRM